MGIDALNTKRVAHCFAGDQFIWCMHRRSEEWIRNLPKVSGLVRSRVEAITGSIISTLVTKVLTLGWQGNTVVDKNFRNRHPHR